VPHRGWTCIAIDDLGQPSQTCEMCEAQPVRYVHTMEHPEHPDTLDVGCVCAGNMEQDYAAAKHREDEFKRHHKQRSKWLQRSGWQFSAAGDQFITTRGFSIAVYQYGTYWTGRIIYRKTNWKVCAKHRYRTSDQVKLAAFDAMLRMQQRIKDGQGGGGDDDNN
jgi:hypothetical protein